MTLQHLTAALLGALALASSAQAASAQLILDGPAQVGQGFTLRLQLDAPFAQLSSSEQLLSYGFSLSYDKQLLQLESVNPAASWDDDSPLLGAGEYGGSRFPGLKNSGQPTLNLATLHFSALASGSATVQVFSTPGNLNQGLSYLIAGPQALSASLSLPITPAVPEPASALLMALGALALCGRRCG